jgi:hypothetical protein
MGARPLGRVIQEHIKKPLADEVLFGKLKKGGTVRVTVEKKEPARPAEARGAGRRTAGQAEEGRAGKAGCPQAAQEGGGQEAADRDPAGQMHARHVFSCVA